MRVLLGCDVFCSVCGAQCDLTSVRTKSKQAGTWQCKACDTTFVQLCRMGADPTDAPQEFFAAAREKGMKETKELWEQFSNKFKQRTDIYEHGGKFLPLSVWEKKGFPIDVIEKGSRPEDVEPHIMFGRVYRVPVKYKGRRHEDVVRSGTNKHAAAANKQAPPAQPQMLAPVEVNDVEAELAEDDSEEEDSSEYSDSSSSSEKKKKKKKKGNKAKRKEKNQEEAQSSKR